MRTACLTFVVLAAAPPAAPADEVIFHARDPLQGRVTRMTLDRVAYTLLLPDGTITPPQQVEARDVRDVILDAEHKPPELAEGEARMDRRDYAGAIKSLQAAARSGRGSDVAKQFAHRHVIRCHLAAGDAAGALKAVGALRAAHPDTFFLREAFEAAFEAHRKGRDAAGMARVVEEFVKRAGEARRDDWKAAAEMLRADLHEFKGESKAALDIHRRHASDPAAADAARLGELRCLGALGDIGALQAGAEKIFREVRDGKALPDRLLMAAYNARGDVHLQQGRAKDALFDYLRVVVHLGARSGGDAPEHEAGLAKAAIAMARVGGELKDPELKRTYRARAGELLTELRQAYGDGSPWVGRVSEALKSLP